MKLSFLYSCASDVVRDTVSSHAAFFVPEDFPRTISATVVNIFHVQNNCSAVKNTPGTSPAIRVITRVVLLIDSSEEAITFRVSFKNKNIFEIHKKTRAPINVREKNTWHSKCRTGLSSTQSDRTLKAFNKLNGTEDVSITPKKKGA